jgi:hypothetical protein
MPSVIDLARRVKEKFPGAYDDLSDVDLGRAVKGKFPGAYDDFDDVSSVGMGDVRASEGRDATAAAERERIVAGARNLPVSMQTNDPATDRRLAELAFEAGQTRDLLPQVEVGPKWMPQALKNQMQFTPGDRAALIAGGLGLAPAAGVLPAAASAGMMGAGMSESSDPAGILKDAGASALIGGTLAKVLPWAAGGIGRWLESKGINWGRKAITGVSSPLARRKELPEEAVRRAFKVDAIRPGSNVGGIANRLQQATDPVADEYRAVLAELESRGVYGPEAEKLAQAFLADSAAAVQNSAMGGASGGPYASALREAGESIQSRALPIGGQGRLGLMQSELMKRGAQSRAATDFVKEGPESLAGAGRKEVAGRLRESIEQAVDEQAALAPEAAAKFRPVKEELHQLLTALGPAREAASRAGRRIPFGLHEAMGLAAGISRGDPVAAVGSAGLMNALKERGASTGAWAANRLGTALSSPATAASPVPALSGSPLAQTLEEWLAARGLGVGQLVPAAADEERTPR